MFSFASCASGYSQFNRFLRTLPTIPGLPVSLSPLELGGAEGVEGVVLSPLLGVEREVGIDAGVGSTGGLKDVAVVGLGWS